MEKTDAIKRAEAAVMDAERNLKEMRRNLLDAQAWVKNAEEIHAQRQRELIAAMEQELSGRGSGKGK